MENFSKDGNLNISQSSQDEKTIGGIDSTIVPGNGDGLQQNEVNEASGNADSVYRHRDTRDKSKVDRQIKEYAISITVAVIIALTLRNYVFARADVEGNSMYSTLHNRDVIFVEKISVLAHSIKRGQIIIFDSRNVNNDIYVKRVIGIGGDEIEIKNGKVFLNGSVLEENYLDKDTFTNEGSFLADKGKYKIPEGYVFVLGDNRGNSLDSRTIGPINIKDIKGHTILRVYPFNQMRIF